MACHLIGDRARISVRSISSVVFKLPVREMSVANECQMQLYHHLKELNLLLQPFEKRLTVTARKERKET